MQPGYRVYPTILPVEKQVTVTIEPQDPALGFQSDAVYEVVVYPTQWLGDPDGAAVPYAVPAAKCGAALQVNLCCAAEQEYVLLIQRLDGETSTVLGEARAYALDDDLFRRRPYKGDFHIHSCRSDGKEPPAYVAGASRRIGLDFMALTDHRQYEPSLEAIRAYENAEIDLQILPGEEVHPPDTRVHIVNFGGRHSVNALFASDAFRTEVQTVSETLTHIPPALRYQYAACIWSFQQIRAGGGLALFCHPYWFTGHRYDVPEALTTLLLAHQPYDALELIGGFHRHQIESNTLQVARYHEERAQGRSIPIVGASDAHGCETGSLFGWYYTIAFAPSPALADIQEAVKGLYSVAVEAVAGEAPRAHGPFRLVKYAHFLMREVFPQHDAICAEEGRAMLAYIAGDPAAQAALRRSKGSVDGLYRRLWAEV